MITEPLRAAKTDRPLPVFVLFLLLPLFVFQISCKRKLESSADRYYKSLSIENNRLFWSLNAGVLNDGLRRELVRADVEPLLSAGAGRVMKLCPEISVRVIADQPLDADYIIDHTVRKRSLTGRYESTSPVLILSSSSEMINRAKLKQAGSTPVLTESILKEIRDGEHRKDALGIAWLSTRSSGSSFVWRAYIREQVRYDLVLTNAYVFTDEAGSPEMRAAGNGFQGLEAALWEAEGRTAGEGTASLVSLFPYIAETAGPAASNVRENAINHITEMLARMVLGWDLRTSPDMPRNVCEEREAFLRIAARFEDGHRDQACAEIRKRISHPEPVKLTPGAKSLLAACGKNG